MQQQKMFMSKIETAVAGLNAALYRDKQVRSVFTATEIWAFLFDEPSTHSGLIQLGHALKIYGYERHNNGRVVRIVPKHHGRFWILRNLNHDWSDADVRTDVKTHQVQ